MAVATAVLVGGDGCTRRPRVRETEEGGGARESARGFQGVCMAMPEASRPSKRQASRVEVARACAVPSFSSAYWQEVEDEAAPGGLGCQVGWPAGLRQVSQVSLCSLLSVFVFLFFCNF